MKTPERNRIMKKLKDILRTVRQDTQESKIKAAEMIKQIKREENHLHLLAYIEVE